MSFGIIAGTTVAATYGTLAGVAAGALTAAGTGMSIASAAGAFNQSVDPANPTSEERGAVDLSNAVFQQGMAHQKMLDPVYWQRLGLSEAAAQQQAKYLQQYRGRLDALNQELGQVNAAAEYQSAGNAGANQAWAGYPQAQAQLASTAASSGGPGSGRFVANVGGLSGQMSRAAREGQAVGRLGQLNEYTQRRGQFGQQLGQYGQRLAAYGDTVAGVADQAQGLYGTYADRVGAGMAMVTGEAKNSAAARDARIQAQMSQNVARNQAMGQIGGALTSVGMAGMGAMGGAASGMGAQTAQSALGAQTAQSALGAGYRSLNGIYSMGGLQAAQQSALLSHPYYNRLYG